MNKMKFEAAMAYESPVCNTVDINSEGVLCASIKQLYEYEDEFNDWN